VQWRRKIRRSRDPDAGLELLTPLEGKHRKGDRKGVSRRLDDLVVEPEDLALVPGNVGSVVIVRLEVAVCDSVRVIGGGFVDVRGRSHDGREHDGRREYERQDRS